MGGKRTGGSPVTRERGEQIAHAFIRRLGVTGLRWEIAGSIRRGKPVVGDVDLLIEDSLDVREALYRILGRTRDGEPARSGLVEGVQVDVLLADASFWGAALLHWTGSVNENIRLRACAKRHGLKLNETGVWKGRQRIAGLTERDCYKAVGATYRLPEAR